MARAKIFSSTAKSIVGSTGIAGYAGTTSATPGDRIFNEFGL